MTSGSEPPRTPILGLNPRARLLLPIFLVVLVVLSLWRLVLAPPPPGTGPGARALELTGQTMGTTWSVKLVARGDGPGEGDRLGSPGELRELREAITTRLAEINALMSTYDETSELSRFNRHLSLDPFAISPDTLEVFRVARHVSEWSGGAFDVTVGPLVAAWGFGATDRAPGTPPAAELAALRARVGHHLVELDADAATLRKREPHVSCDFSAIAKGYGVDAIAELVEGSGARNFLVEIGGEVRVRGRRPDGGRWRLAIERPEPAGRAVHRVLELEDAALATSGDYRNFYQREGVVLSHLIDPRTAHPIEHGLASVSVVHARAVYADAYATALAVLGPDEGRALAERDGVAAYFIVRDPGGALRSIATRAFVAIDEGAAETEGADAGRGERRDP